MKTVLKIFGCCLIVAALINLGVVTGAQVIVSAMVTVIILLFVALMS